MAERTSIRAGLAFAVPSVVIYLAVQLAYWPAQMTPDSFTQWLYVLRPWGMTDIHSVVHVWLIRLAAQVWFSPGAFVLVQVAALSLVTGFILEELRHWRAPVWSLVVSALLVPLFPTSTFVATVLWVDIPYSIAILVAFWLILRWVRTGRPPIEGLTITLIIAGLLRPNGVIAVALIALAILAFVRTRPALLAVALIVAAPLAIRTLLYPALGIAPFPKVFMAAVPLHIVGAYADELSEQERGFVAKIAPIETLKQTYACGGETLFHHPSTNRDALAREVDNIVRLALGLIMRDPLVYVKHQLCATELLWKPYTWTPRVIGRAPLSIWPNDSIHENPVLPQLRPILRAYYDWSLQWQLIWRPALHLYLVIGIALLAAALRRRADLLLIALPAVATTLSIAPLMHVPAYRYQFSVTLMALLSLPLIVSLRFPQQVLPQE